MKTYVSDYVKAVLAITLTVATVTPEPSAIGAVFAGDSDLDGVVEQEHDSVDWSILSESLSPADTGDVVHTIPTPGPNCQGLTWDGNYLWVSDISTHTIYKVSPIDGAVVQSFSSPGRIVEGLAWDGTYLWACANGGNGSSADTLFQVNPLNGAVVKSLVIAANWVHGITRDGQYLWGIDFASKLIYRIDPLTGTLLASIAAPGGFSIGLTWDGQYLWTDDFGSGQLYQIDPGDGTIIRSVAAPHSNPRDLAWDGQYIWVVSGEADTLYKVDVGLQRVTTLRVPSEYPTIQAAIDASTEGDTILVAPRTYTGSGNRDLHIWHSWPIVLKSESGPENTIIDCEGSSDDPHRGLYLDYYGSQNNVVDGFTFRRGYDRYGNGGGIWVDGVSPTIQNCVFENNSGHALNCTWAAPAVSNCRFIGNTGDYGGAVRCSGGEARFTNCTFENNSAQYNGGALYCTWSSPTVANCLFDGNYAQQGGAISSLYYLGDAGSPMILTNCTFIKNSANVAAGIYLDTAGMPFINNCIIAFSTQGEAISVNGGGEPALSCCDIYGNAGGDWVGYIANQYGVSGNFSRDPLFCDFADGDYRITANSPCAPANNSCVSLIGAYGVGCGAIELVLTPTSIDFSAIEGEDNPPPDTIAIANAGGGVLTWSADKSAEWLSVSDSTGTAPSSAVVSADISGLSRGVYTDTIIVGAKDAINSPQYVPVALTVQVAGQIALSPDSMHFSADSGGSDPDPQSLTINNTGGGTLVCTLTTNAAWLIPSDRVVTAPSTVTVNADITGLPPGQYSGIIAVSSDDATNSPQYVSVGLTIDTANRPPEFVVICDDTVLIEGQKFECDVVVSDLDDDPIDFSCQQCPDGSHLTTTSNTTALFSFEPDYRHVDSSYTVIISASDGVATISDGFSMSIVNRQLEVIGIDPHSGAGQDILISRKPIEIQFNEALQKSSLEIGLIIASSKGDSFNHVYYPAEYYVTFDNTSDYLMSLDTITCSLRTSILDMSGNPLDSEYVYTLYTGVGVFPGDANDDGIVDERDILPMGLYWGNEGPSRQDSDDVSWGIKPAHVWAFGSRWTPLASVYADADGSGKIDGNDICGVTNNWAKQAASGKRVVQGDEVDVEAVLRQFEGDVLQQMYEALTDCPESEGKVSVMKMFESLLREPTANLPTTYQLSQNYPNPFNPYTVIRFYLPQSGNITLSVYNIVGQKVAVLLDGYVNKGHGEVTWDGIDHSGRPAASGIYFYRLEAAEVSITKRMTLLK